MKYNKIRLFTSLNVIDLPLVGVAGVFDKFVCKEVEGVGNVDNDVSITDGYFQASDPRPKQFVVRMGLNPDYASGEVPSDLRDYVYGLLTGGPTQDGVSVIVFQGATEVCRSEGCRISKIEGNPFSKDPEVLLTLETLGPYFYKSAPTVVSLAGMSLTTPSFTNPGTAPTGFHMKFVIPAGWNYVELQTPSNQRRIRFDWTGTFGFSSVAGDIIEFETTPLKRYATLTRGGTVYKLLSTMPANAEWLQLYGGVNALTFGPGAITSWTDISFTAKYWGL